MKGFQSTHVLIVGACTSAILYFYEGFFGVGAFKMNE